MLNLVKLSNNLNLNFTLLYKVNMFNTILIQKLSNKISNIIDSFLTEPNHQITYNPVDFQINEQLRKACENNDLPAAKELISHGASPDYGLEGACYAGNECLMDEMVKLGAKNFNFALRGACIGNHKQLYIKLFKYGANDPVIIKSLSTKNDEVLIFDMMRYNVPLEILGQIPNIDKLKIEF